MLIQNVAYPPPASEMTPRSPASITDLIVHHSDGPATQTPLQIDAEHRAEGWAMIGYNYVIGPEGIVYKGRPDSVVPAAAYGDNAASVDVCLLGDFQPGTPGYSGPVPAIQLTALKELALWLHRQYPTIVRTIGHRDVAAMHPDNPGAYSTACPGDTLYAALGAVREYVAAGMAA